MVAVHTEYSVAVAQTRKKKTKKDSIARGASSTNSLRSSICRHMHDIQTKPRSESGASLLAVSGTRERRREDSETEEVEECALSVIGAARRCIVPAVGMKTREFPQLFMCTQHEDVRASLASHRVAS